MDMNISGSGKIPAGEYDRIKVSGSAEMQGMVKCASLNVSGALYGVDLICTGPMSTSGGCDFDGDVTAESMHTSGGFNCDGNMTVQNDLRISGGTNVDGSLKCGTLEVHGGLNADGEIEAETVTVRGTMFCKGLLNAEYVDIDTKSGCAIGSIGGSRITISYTKRKLFPNLIKVNYNGETVRGVKVLQTIEGDEIDLKYVTCPRVSGRTVKIGEVCDIDLLQYSESYEIHEKAKVGKIEKI